MGLFKKKQAPQQGRDVTRDVKLTRDKECRTHITGFVDNGVEDAPGELVLEYSGAWRYVCRVNGLPVGLCADLEAVGAALKLKKGKNYPERVPCRVVMRMYDGNAWSACSVL